MVQETLYIGQSLFSPLQSRHLGTSHSSPSCYQLSYFPESHWWSEIAFLSKVILVLQKARRCRIPNMGCSGAESSWWFAVLPKNCMRCDAWAGTLSWWSCQSPAAHRCGLLNHLNSFCEGMFKLSAKFDAELFLYSLSHFECNDYTAHVLTQWCLPPPLTSAVKLSLFMHVHSSPLSLAASLHRYVQTTAITLTMVWLFLDRFHIYAVCTYIYKWIYINIHLYMFYHIKLLTITIYCYLQKENLIIVMISICTWL